MNWKDQGFKVGNNAYIVNHSMWHKDREVIGEEVEIIYIGRKILKVKRNDKIIEFRSQTAKSDLWGYYYGIYLNEADYLESKKKAEQKRALREEIKNAVNKLSYAKLLEIDAIIKGQS